MNSIWITLGTIFAGLAVLTGAFAAHLLERSWGNEPQRIEWVETAARYQMYHSLALVAVGILSWHSRSWAARVAGISFLLGILLFSGSLYVLAWTKIKMFGAITPLGGLAFLIGWGSLAIAGLSAPKSLEPPPTES